MSTAGNGSRGRHFFAILCALAALLSAPAGHAMSESPFAGYFHTAWLPSDGAPADVRGIVQDKEGWLWIGAQEGLYRFDGQRFEHMDAVNGHRLHKSSIISLAYLDGALWIGYQFGGIERFKDGGAVFFDESSGLPPAAVIHIVQPAGGPVSAATGGGLYDWDGKRWNRAWPAKNAESVANPAVMWALGGADGVLLINAGNDVLRRARGAAAFTRVDSDDDHVQTLFAGYGGGLWASGVTKGFMEYDAAADRFRVNVAANVVDGRKLLFQRDGTPWLVDDGIKLLDDRVHYRMIDELTRAGGLSDDAVMVSFEDREGNFWMGTGGGIDRFRRSKVHALVLPKGIRSPSVRPGADGSVWVGSMLQEPLRQIRADGTQSSDGLAWVDSMARGDDGAIWAANGQQLARYAGGRQQRWELPGPNARQIQCMASDRDGSLWLSMLGRKQILHFKDGAWSASRERTAYAETVVFLHVDRAGRLWQGYTNNRAAVAQGDVITRYGAEQGLRTGNVLSIATYGEHVWVGGEEALMFLRQGRFVALTARDGGDFKGVSGIVETADGDLWVNGMQGISHIRAASLKPVYGVGGGDTRVEVERLNYQDGVRGQPTPLRPLPSLVAGDDGRLWFHTNRSAGWIDPQHMPRNPLPPPVYLRTLVVGERSYEAVSGLRLPERSESLRIDYTALGLTMPARVRFRYRLRGVDADWIDAGARRSAYYTNLSPRDYRFDVQAANEDGVWNTTGATLAFSIAPMLTQTVWFRIACGGVALLALWLLHRWRLQRQAAQMRARMEERLDERGRIARELHDTLLQSVQGLVLKIHGVAVRMPAKEPMRDMLDAALVQAEGTILEGRNRVRDLRSREDGSELASMLAAVTHELTGEDCPPCEVVTAGTARVLAPGIGVEVFAIGREAMLNAFRHARAGKVTVVVAYRPRQLRLLVTDDGVGMPPVVVAEGGRPGHWGIAGMRERAAGIGGELVLRAREGGGTECMLILPAAQAYAATARGWDGWRWWRR
jgi:signal transduction histidine kinase/ligand-binding sensor domain-containing protein